MNTVPKAVHNQQVASEIVGKVKAFETWREPYKQKWDRFYKLYRGYIEKKNYPWQSNIFVPYSFSTVETIVPRLISTKPQVDVLPQEEQDQLYAELQAKIIDYEWDKMNMEALMPDMIRQFLIYGTSIMKVYWKKRIAKEMQEVPIDPEMPELGTKEVETERSIEDEPCVELVDLYDFFWDPTGYNIETCQWVAHRTYRSFNYLMEQQKLGLYKNVALLKQKKGKIFIEKNDFTERQSATDINDPRNYIVAEDGHDDIEIIEYWEDNRVVTLANREVVIREEDKNPLNHGKKPFIRVVDQSVPKEFCGIGEIEPIETLQYELNDMRNQRMDNATMIMNRMWIVKNGANVDEDELVSDVGGIIHTDDIQGITAVQIGDLPNSSYREETLIKADIQQSTGITDYTKGVASDALANETATGISLMQEAGNARLRLKMMNLEKAVQEIGEMLVSLNAQFITDEKVFRITGEQGTEWVTVKPERLKENFDVIVRAGSTLPENDAIKKKQAMELFQLFNGDPMIDQAELRRELLRFSNVRNINKLLAPQTMQPAIPGQETQTPPSEIPGGVAGLPGAQPSLNQQGTMQQTTPQNPITR
jgi:hypothetical protein